VQNQGSRIHIPQDWNIVPHQVILRGFAGTPVRCDRGKFTDDQRLDVRPNRLFIVGVDADISDVRVCQADNLAGIARIRKNFLISGEAGVENDFAASASVGSRGAAMKNAPVFERKNSLPSF
jgi:hypothetical protein